jgi:hypothetical protein
LKQKVGNPVTSRGQRSTRPGLLFGGRKKKKKEDTRKKKFLNSAYRNVGCYSLGICSQAICRVFACAVIHTAKHLKD